MRTAAGKRGEAMLHGELRDGRGNGSCRGLSVARQVRDLPGFLALSLPFPD
jgi:hypothetical protein